ncbi:amino acid/polyamine/organocation transporter (APC superfamily) [Saccharopolyspora erythraea NRRL 2338]|uniref:APC family permease n=3 Tax=Saccharopolyspora erythraea TaxID=1836 RepID=A0ABP3N183_SACER|nr:APC family permease [Saccharopolyspora erythraea]EQD86870.1 amino acid transporter [Saccharopolyspora erythraea D]PFG97118.1 amino acid/polyamine/organocation transporter (APC superfamily) [Saccharopolyspora erythraea NRRL 2338]QRK87323.1 APC family permease [Saccharopolyspora erythraea]CAM03418.1 probable amino acid transporter, APC superfamily [Saccharopolyspora erythraea NRRL 2338]
MAVHSVPTGLLVTVGYAIGSIGAWTAICIWVAATLIGLLQNMLFAEIASMLPGSSGGITRYAAEGWKRYFAPLSAVAAFGYWIGWSFSIAVNAAAIGELVHSQWFPQVTDGFRLLSHEIGLSELIALSAIAGGWALNYFGVKIAANLNKCMSVVVIAGLAALVVSAPASGGWDLADLTWYQGGNWLTLVVWFYVTAWTTYGTEIRASFAPEYRDPARDTARALQRATLFMVVVFFAVPLAMSGAIGEQRISDDPLSAFALAFQQSLGTSSWLGVSILVVALFLGMVSTTADGGRALYGLAEEGMTLRQLHWLNRWGVPGRSLTLDAVINAVILLLLGEPLSILLAGNLGYLVAMTPAVGSFLLLRKDRPHWPRPIRRGRIWVPVAAALFVFDLFVLVVGMTHPSPAGYGGFRETAAGVGILLISVVLFAYRRLVQDRKPLRWRIETPVLPPENAQLAADTAAADGKPTQK